MATRGKPVDRLKDCLARLPGIGPKTSERLAFHLLTVPDREALELAESIRDAVESTRTCRICFNFDETDPCSVCSDKTRDRSMILVVEDPRDLASFELAGYRGLYHVLQGRISTLDGIGPDDLTLAALLARVDRAAGRVEEVCLATNPDLEGEATAKLVQEKLAEKGVPVTRLARGLPAGGTIHQASQSMLADAVEGRRPLS